MAQGSNCKWGMVGFVSSLWGRGEVRCKILPHAQGVEITKIKQSIDYNKVK